MADEVQQQQHQYAETANAGIEAKETNVQQEKPNADIDQIKSLSTDILRDMSSQKDSKEIQQKEQQLIELISGMHLDESSYGIIDQLTEAKTTFLRNEVERIKKVRQGIINVELIDADDKNALPKEQLAKLLEEAKGKKDPLLTSSNELITKISSLESELQTKYHPTQKKFDTWKAQNMKNGTEPTVETYWKALWNKEHGTSFTETIPSALGLQDFLGNFYYEFYTGYKNLQEEMTLLTKEQENLQNFSRTIEEQGAEHQLAIVDEIGTSSKDFTDSLPTYQQA